MNLIFFAHHLPIIFLLNFSEIKIPKINKKTLPQNCIVLNKKILFMSINCKPTTEIAA